MRTRRWLYRAAAAAAGLMTAALITVPATAATSAPAGNYYQLYFTWAANPCQGGFGGGGGCSAWGEVTGGLVDNDQNNAVDLSIVGPGGYQELQVWRLDGSFTGYCLGWSKSQGAIVQQKCTGDTWQLWAGNGAVNDVIWNEWYEAHTGWHACPYNGGYTQSAVTSLNGPGTLLSMSCPLAPYLQWPYTTAQEWQLVAS